MERPSKRTKLLSDDEASDSDIGSASKPQPNGFSVNEAYAARFEHNQKRKEQHQLEEKYGKPHASKSHRKSTAPSDDEESSSSNESEDDEAELATEAVDDEILATLEAIRKKDPRVYDKDVRFYTEYDPESGEAKEKEEKPMFLSDYHRRNLLEGHAEVEEEDGEEDVPRTYAQEQDRMRKELVGEMHAVANGTAEEEEDGEEEDGLLVARTKPKHDALPASSTRQRKIITDADVAAADNDPETYLSNFMASRAWLPTATSKWQAFDSDDSEDDARADKFEEAYNMRFEDPAKANEELHTFARDTGKYSVRRDEKKSARQRTREREREKKEAEKREREEGKARLRKLKVEEMEAKVKRIREAAGLGKEEVVDIDAWRDVLEGDFEDDKWEAEMERRFGDKYYATKEDDGARDEDDEEDNEQGRSKRRKLHKPKWDDDIDIKDLVPDFVDDEQEKPNFTLSDDEEQEPQEAGVPITLNNVEEEDEAASEANNDDDDPHPSKPRKTRKSRALDKSATKRASRLQRAAIEHLVDASLPLDSHPQSSTSGAGSVFRYRPTSPTTFGLTARDILFADDSQLNEFAGLKKLAAWREEGKKARDRKRFSKKARLREWRRGVFGREEGAVAEGVGKGEGEGRGNMGDGGDAGAKGEGKKKKRKRGKGGKGKSAEVSE